MASYLPSSSSASIIKPSPKQAFYFVLKVRAQSYRHEGKASGMVDANMRVLRLRIEEIRRKQRVEKWCRCKYGWNYEAGYNFKLFELAGIVGGTFGITCLIGTVLLSLVSLLVHLNYISN
ncbi:hypothetical protein P3X46_029476 [Hevea brasiliensis]|uniref:Uncharacterized protein n=1 Tax=Hevea brasiliensis TaxID=3981 RepID=A0ABQ9KTQ8_HEVBR|nr:hypothetical protein P3X46_029476 [Hevea brasiliensis]